MQCNCTCLVIHFQICTNSNLWVAKGCCKMLLRVAKWCCELQKGVASCNMLLFQVAVANYNSELAAVVILLRVAVAIASYCCECVLQLRVTCCVLLLRDEIASRKILLWDEITSFKILLWDEIAIVFCLTAYNCVYLVPKFKNWFTYLFFLLLLSLWVCFYVFYDLNQ